MRGATTGQSHRVAAACRALSGHHKLAYPGIPIRYEKSDRHRHGSGKVEASEFEFKRATIRNMARVGFDTHQRALIEMHTLVYCAVYVEYAFSVTTIPLVGFTEKGVVGV